MSWKNVDSHLFDIKRENYRLIMALLAIVMALFVIFDKDGTGGRYVYLAISATVMLLGTKGRIKITFEPWYCFNILMIVYTAINSFWSSSQNSTLQMAYRQLVTFLCFMMLYIGYSSTYDSIMPFFKSIKWGAWIVTFYLIKSYGVSTLLSMMSNGTRLANDLGNINIFGLFISFGVLSDIFEIYTNKRINLFSILILPEVFVIAATQSRKAFLALFIGIAMCVVLYNNNQQHKIRSILLIIVGVIAFLLLVKWLSTIEIFSGIVKRMTFLINFVTGEGGAGSSVESRELMIETGWALFRLRPIGGNGMGTSYLHNNFIDLLYGGGIIGFGIYYARFAYILVMLFIYRNNKNEGTNPGLILVIIFLILDYARITYYTKSSQVLILAMFLQIHYQRFQCQNAIVYKKR